MPISTGEEVKSNESSNKRPEFGLSGRKIIYDKDGKPCRTCNELSDFQFVTGKIKNPKAVAKAQETPSTSPGGELKYAKEDPPDVARLGKSSWTLLHSIAATFPETPTTKQQQDMRSFLNLFAGFYPCWYCGEDFVKYIDKHEPETKSQDDLGKWLCEAHNDVNKKLGKPQFDCNFWKKRWKDGWDE
ncbi:ERV1 [Candida theae]|uniref:Sulfhydryl oxidase n=1 Tax=Candida theae TaxID=1198502 RepID=A0AAD5BHI7_9ASCO|nr:ERV1 [Candida theae]KAI5963889.1 ERV1 [Candida theae]